MAIKEVIMDATQSFYGKFLLISLILIILLIILLLIEKRLYKKVVDTNIKPSTESSMELEILKNKSQFTKNDLTKLDSVARKMFEIKFNLHKSLDYAELYEYFLKSNRQELAKFCKSMPQYLYSEINPEKYEIKTLISYLEQEAANWK